MALVDRAAKAGFDTLLVTVDVPVAGARLRDKRNGMSIPPALTPATVVNAIPRPAWWINFLTTEPLAFASLDRWSGTVAELLDTMFDPTVDFDDLAWIKEQWPGKVVVKGVQNLADARRLADLGVDGIILSNHGGRQLDRAPIPFHLLPEVVREVGDDLEVHLDTGIMSGADIVAAVALGARFTLIGRAYLYGLMAGGRDGRRPGHRHPAHRDRADDAAARCGDPGRARAGPRHPARPAGAPAPLMSAWNRPQTRLFALRPRNANGPVPRTDPFVVRVQRQALTLAPVSASVSTSAFFLARAAATYSPARVTSTIAP